MGSLVDIPGDPISGNTGIYQGRSYVTSKKKGKSDSFLDALKDVAAKATTGDLTAAEAAKIPAVPNMGTPGGFTGAGKRPDFGNVYMGGKTPNMTAYQAAQSFYTWDDKKLDSFRKKLEDAGYSEAKKADRNTLFKAWAGLVDHSNNYGAKGKRLSPFDVLDSQGGPGAGGDVGVGGAGLGGEFGTGDVSGGSQGLVLRQSTSTSFTDPNTARAIMNQTMSQLLGRNPTNKEIRQFTNALHSYEKKNPMVTQELVDTGTGMVVKDASTDKRMTQAGAQQMAEDEVRKTKEFGTMSAVNYMNALRSLVNNPG